MKGQLDIVGTNTIVVSPTQLASMQTCMRMWRHRYIDGRVRATCAPARDGGRAFDQALNLRYLAMGSQPATPKVEQDMVEAITASMSGLDLPLDEWRTPDRYIEAVRLYNQTYQEEQFDVLGVQLPFEVELGEVPAPDGLFAGREINEFGEVMVTYRPDDPKVVKVRLHGILDRLIHHRQTGLVLVLDTKTASQWGTNAQAAYDNHGQMKAYSWAVPQVRKQLGDQAGPPWATLPDHVHGCMVDAVVLRKPYAERTVRQAKLKASDAEAKPAGLPRTEFHRFVVTYSPERLEEWRLDALRWVKLALDCVADGHFPQNETVCHSQWGRPCEYLDICLVPKAQREMVLQSDAFQDYDRGPFVNKELDKPDRCG